MTREEQRLYLIKHLLAENPRYAKVEIPQSATEQKQLLRSLFNVRPATPISSDFLDIQDTYLQAEIADNGIVDTADLSPTSHNSKLYLWQGDITRLKIGAIVNAANSALLGCFQPCHACIDNIIHTLAGVQLRLACDEIMGVQGHDEATGQAKITSAYNLPCDYVLHTVGPIISGELTQRDKDLLANCYQSCLQLASQNGIKSIAFCCISTGVFSFPQQEAAEVAVRTVTDFLQNDSGIGQVVFNVFTDKDKKIYTELLI